MDTWTRSTFISFFITLLSLPAFNTNTKVIIDLILRAGGGGGRRREDVGRDGGRAREIE